MTETTRSGIAVLHRAARSPRVIVAATVAGLLVTAMLVSPSTTVQASSVFSAERIPGDSAFIAAHRGDRDAAPENTIPAFEAALQGAVTFVEVDIQLTRDGVPVLMHDTHVDRTTNGSGRVSDLTLAELRRLDAGSWFSPRFAGTKVPTLAEFFDLLAPSEVFALLELKGFWSVAEARTVTAMIEVYGLGERVILAGFDLSTVQNVVRADARLPIAVITKTLPRNPAAFALLYGAVAIVTSHQTVKRNPAAVPELHGAGIGIIVYTLNSKSSWSDALELGVDGIVTDRPVRLEAWLARNQ